MSPEEYSFGEALKLTGRLFDDKISQKDLGVMF